MAKKIGPALSFVLLLLVILVASGGVANLAAQGQGASIKLQGGSFNPSQGEKPDLPPGLTISGYAAGVRGYYIVQFNGPVQQSWKDEAGAAGAEFLDYIPEFAFKAKMNPAQAARVAGQENVAWVGLFQPAYKLSPAIDQDKPSLLRVRLERGAQRGRAMAAIAKSGAEILARDGDILLIGANPDQIVEIANVLDVAWMENYVSPQKHNEFAAGVILGSNTANANGYDGSTQIAAVADTGLGDGTVDGAHPDIPIERITSLYNLPGAATGCFKTIVDDGAIDVDSGHGTHTSVSVLGDGGDNGVGKGAAPAASLVFQATENWATIKRNCLRYGWPPDGYFLTGLPDDLHDMYQQAYDDGARIHSNSWGSSLAGEYTIDSANTDDFIWDNPDMAITFSAGNEGIDANANGVVDSDSIGSPATAKNVITVGASENNRADNWPCDTNLLYTSYDAYQTGETCSSMGGENFLGTWGQRYGTSFLSEPLYSDVTAGNQEQMASWSSRGPVDDGRIKPDVVAPGTWILSGFSDMYQEGYEGDSVNPQNDLFQWDGWGMPLNSDYKYMGGTSMSNPIVAGAATVMRDYYQKAHAHNASAALVKASLINSAVDLADENNDGADDNDFPIPNDHEGWGRVNLVNATDGNHQYVENGIGINTSGIASYQYTVAAGASSFKVTLVWSDFPSTETAGQNLVNDLDLLVTAPGGTQYRGNVFSGGWSQSGGNADRINNVENVYVQSAASGSWTVDIIGFNVANGPQPFALVVDGIFGQVDNTPTVTITTPSDGATVSGSVNVTAEATDDNGVVQVEFFVNGISIGIDSASPYGVSWDSTLVTDGSHAIKATATDTIGQTASDVVNVTVDNINDLPVASFTYSCSGFSCSFDASASFDADGTITSYAWDFGDTNSGTGLTASHEYAAADTYNVVLMVTDNDGGSSTDSQQVTVGTVPAMHVADLDASTTTAKGGRWNVEIIITVHDDGNSPLANATVSGLWSSGATGTGTCTTDGNGQCMITKSNISKKSNSVTFAVDNISHSSYSYNPAANDDPDGDSDGTTITVLKP